MSYAKLVKEFGITTVIGGWHPTLAVEQTLSSPWIDIVVRGEGEFTFRELIETGSPENVDGLSYIKDGTMVHNPDRPFLANLDELRLPARHLVKDYKYKIFNMNCDAIETSRGCPQGCKFCSTHVVYKRSWRPRSVENIIEELEIISKQKRITDVFFVDDNILVNMKRVGKLCIEIIRGKREGRIRDLKFFFQGRLDSMARHPYITKLMGKAGFWIVLVGVEATDDKTLKKIEKGCKIDKIREGIQALHEAGIVVMGNVILGVDLEASIDDVITTIKRTNELTIDLPSFTLLTPFPSTGFYSEMKEKNLLLSEDYSKYNWLTPVIKTPNFSPQALRTLLFIGFYNAGFYGGSRGSKLTLFRRVLKSRGMSYMRDPRRVYRSALAYFSWRKIVNSNLQSLDKKVKKQIKYGTLNEMKELKNAILNG